MAEEARTGAYRGAEALPNEIWREVRSLHFHPYPSTGSSSKVEATSLIANREQIVSYFDITEHGGHYDPKVHGYISKIHSRDPANAEALKNLSLRW